MNRELSNEWAAHFGLAPVPLFSADDVEDGAVHSVLLDGGFGSFAVSVTEEEPWKDRLAASWAWSSNLPHHVTVTERKVAVTRWDNPQVEVLTRRSVESQIDAFYRFLRTDRVRSNQTVIDHVLTLFRQVRSLVVSQGMDDASSVKAFLGVLARLIQENGPKTKSNSIIWSSGPEAEALIRALPNGALSQLIQDAWEASLALRLDPALAVRHAGSAIFQEAHFALLRSPVVDLFGYAGVAQSQQTTRGGAHFTPAALARIVVEQAIAQIPGLVDRPRLVVSDPACGSGAFLHEAMRTLRRIGYKGELVISGCDISTAAIDMATFVVGQAASEWTPAGGLVVDLKCADSLRDPLPVSDLTLMNPPFVSWATMTDEQRDQLKTVLGSQQTGRSDLSMAFITRAIEFLAPGGTLGVLFPASLLSLQAAATWRHDLLERTDLRLLASLGEYGLFTHALVQVAVGVFTRPSNDDARSDTTLALVTSNQPEATGDALRGLRRAGTVVGEMGDRDTWRLFHVPSSTFKERSTWRLVSPGVQRALKTIAESGTTTIGMLFDVKQGVRTGNNDAFVIDDAALQQLPVGERKYFRPALMGDSIHDGQIVLGHWVFYPHGERSGREITSEAGLQKYLKVFANHYLFPHKQELQNRAHFRQSDRNNWWELTRPRTTWALDVRPRLVSKYFGGPGGFALDLSAELVVVQGFAWLLKVDRELDELDDDGPTTRDVLAAYAALFNSRVFSALLSHYSPHVAGGQFDLSPRHTNQVPIPDLIELLRHEQAGKLVSQLVACGHDIRLDDPSWVDLVEFATCALYGSEAIRELSAA
jgi:hypothetical protein